MGAVERGEGDGCSTSWQVKQRYLEVGRTMKDYEDRKYKQWKESMELSLPHLMKKSLLTKVSPSTPPQRGQRGEQRCHGQQQLHAPLGWLGILFQKTSRGAGETAQPEACAPWVFPASERPFLKRKSVAGEMTAQGLRVYAALVERGPRLDSSCPHGEGEGTSQLL